ncbi:MAG: hypothetical protein U9R48_06090 [Chloroflexota bacterium]|nr:hypothetical protein [Chloroflexota bacterium]
MAGAARQYDRRRQLPKRVSIEVHPGIVDSPGRLGDYEVDATASKGLAGALMILTERT